MQRTSPRSRRTRWAAAACGLAFAIAQPAAAHEGEHDEAPANIGPGVAVRTEIGLGPDGSDPAIVISGDDAITLVLEAGTFPSHGDDRVVLMRAVPRATDGMGGAIQPLAFFGKAVEIEATYQPSGDAAEPLAPIQVILSYPEASTLHADVHEMAYSVDGTTWRSIESRDAADLQQVEADLEELGLVAVVGEPSAAGPVADATPASSGISATVWILVAVAGLAFVGGVLLIVRGGRAG